MMEQHESPLFDEATLQRLDAIEPSIFDMDEAVNQTNEFLTRNLEQADPSVTQGVMLSGGVDGAILAAKLKAKGCTVVAVTSGTPDSPDMQQAQATAEALEIDWYPCPLEASDALDSLNLLTTILNYTGLYTIASGLVVDASLKRLNLLEINHAWAANGLGFGWHENKNRDHTDSITAPEETWQETRDALTRLFGRPDNIKMYARLGDYYEINVHLPFEHEDGIALARRISAEVHSEDGIDKAVLRKIAMRSGIPSRISYRPKDPLQRSSNTFDLIRSAMYEIAQRELDDQVSFDWDAANDEYLDLRMFLRCLHTF